MFGYNRPIQAMEVYEVATIAEVTDLVPDSKCVELDTHHHWVIVYIGNPMEPIQEFSGEYRFLSNFYPAQVMLDGNWYPTVEHAYQAAKTTSPKVREIIRSSKTPGKAKRSGRVVPLRENWETVKQQVMLDLLRQKFYQGPLCAKLLSTAGHELIEGNAWGDTYWGVVNGSGQNHLGKLLMQVRGECQVRAENNP